MVEFNRLFQKSAEIVLGKISIFEDPNQSFWELERVQWSYQTLSKTHTKFRINLKYILKNTFYNGYRKKLIFLVFNFSFNPLSKHVAG